MQNICISSIEMHILFWQQKCFVTKSLPTEIYLLGGNPLYSIWLQQKYVKKIAAFSTLGLLKLRRMRYKQKQNWLSILKIE